MATPFACDMTSILIRAELGFPNGSAGGAH